MGENSATMMQFWHFGFSASQFDEDFCKVVETTIQNVLGLFQEVLEECTSNKEKNSEQVRKLYELYMTKAQEPLTKFKETTSKIFHLSDNIVIPTFRGLKPVSPSELSQLKSEVDQLEKKYLQAVVYRAHLKDELKKFEHHQVLYDKVDLILKYYESIKVLCGEKSFKDLYDCCRKLEEMLLTKIYGNSEDDDVADYGNLFTNR